ncbi:hypothetical protein ACFSMW_13320 [Virgibacillus halophilus]|uniref:Uncharacterized protein n=1 Tax=Tigheibacillus halophilus TaxID=361280 RepID=A0ABU5C984_9BACI|nr:hypothetical protein [Virgibacillus halophilus]
MHFIDEFKKDLSAEQRQYFNAWFVGTVGALARNAKGRKIDVIEIEKAAKYARKEAIENAHRCNGRHF